MQLQKQKSTSLEEILANYQKKVGKLTSPQTQKGPALAAY